MGGSSFKRWLLFAGLIVAAVIIYAAPWQFWQLRLPVKKHCLDAQAELGGECVEALIAVVESDQPSFLEKNRAVWTLGQLADERALPALRDICSGVALSAALQERRTSLPV